MEGYHRSSVANKDLLEVDNFSIEDGTEGVVSSSTDMEGVQNFSTEDRKKPVAPYREAGTFVLGIQQGINLPMETRTELVLPSNEAKSLGMGMDCTNSPTEKRMEATSPTRETETFVRGTEGGSYPMKNPIAPSRETETMMEPANFIEANQIVPVSTCREPKTLVLFGRVGNGKSAVGNSIFGKKEFASRISASGVTTTCKLGTTTLDDGQVVNVIDTPGLFDLSRGSDRPEYLADEMVNCITLAKDGIHGFILVCSIKTRFSTEEEGVILSLGKLFGEKIYDYMVVVFTGGDELEMTFPEYKSTCPSSLQKVLQLCKNRVVLFDNRTKDEDQRKNQVQQLMKYVGKIRDENGQSYKSEAFERIKKEALGKHEADTPMMCELPYPIGSVYGAQNSKNQTAQQTSSVRGFGNESSKKEAPGKHEANKAMMYEQGPIRNVYEAQKSKNQTTRQKSPARDYENQTSKKQAPGKHEANTPMMPIGSVHGQQNSKNHASSVGGYENEASSKLKLLEKQLREAKETSRKHEQYIETLQQKILELNQPDRGGNFVAYVVREMKACTIM